MTNLHAYDKIVKEHCGTFSLLQTAKTGYTKMSQFTDAYDNLYTNPRIQRDFGVEELAYMKSKPADILNHLKTDHIVSEGEARFTPSFVPEIAEGVFVRQLPIFNKEGKYSAPPIDVNDPNQSAELTNLRQQLERKRIGEVLLVQQRAREEALRMTDKVTASAIKDFHSAKLRNAGLMHRSKEVLKRAGYKYGVGEFNNNLSAEQQREYVIDRFFDNDPELFLEWKEERDAGRGDFFPDPRRDLSVALEVAAGDPTAGASETGGGAGTEGDTTDEDTE